MRLLTVFKLNERYGMKMKQAAKVRPKVGKSRRWKMSHIEAEDAANFTCVKVPRAFRICVKLEINVLPKEEQLTWND